MSSNQVFSSFLKHILSQLDSNSLSTEQQLLLSQYYCKSLVLNNPSIKIERDLWDYLSLGILLLESSSISEPN